MKKKFYQDLKNVPIKRNATVFLALRPNYWTKYGHIRFAVLTAKVVGVHEYWKGRKTNKNEIAVTFQEDGHQHLYCVPVDQVFANTREAFIRLQEVKKSFVDSLEIGIDDKYTWLKRGRS